jgi:hypothetical protein
VGIAAQGTSTPVIPIAFAHESAAIPLGVGSDVLTLIAQEKLGMRTADRA